MGDLAMSGHRAQEIPEELRRIMREQIDPMKAETLAPQSPEEVSLREEQDQTHSRRVRRLSRSLETSCIDAVKSRDSVSNYRWPPVVRPAVLRRARNAS
jgi:hypothetical protein